MIFFVLPRCEIQDRLKMANGFFCILLFRSCLIHANVVFNKGLNYLTVIVCCGGDEYFQTDSYSYSSSSRGENLRFCCLARFLFDEC